MIAFDIVFPPNMRIRLAGPIVILILTAFPAAARTLDPLIKITVAGPTEIKVEVEMRQPGVEWSFRNAYASSFNLADRIENFEATGLDDQPISVHRVATGEYRAKSPAQKFTYNVRNLAPRVPDLARVSWLHPDYGYLMLADLLPTTLDQVAITLELRVPANWSVQSAGGQDSAGRYAVNKPEDAVFYVGRNLRRTSRSLNGLKLNLAVTGDWKVSDRAIMDAASKVFEHYLENTGFRLREDPLILVAPFPLTAGNTWKAQTRGPNVVLAMDPSANFRNWKGQLGIIFTHELLHLWVPNSLRLSGEYDWFFEGFTLYEALLTARELKLITFQEYLDTLARVYDSYLSYPNDLSLIEASERRWTTAFPLVYDKGMLVALLYDLRLRTDSDQRLTLSDSYRQLFNSPSVQSKDANEVIIALLNASLSDKEFSRRYIESNGVLDLTETLQPYGIIFDASGKKTRAVVARNLTEKQLKVLKSLGYRR